jgi:excisionase family DNA binding protein
MIIPNNIIEPAISLKDQYFDLKGLEVYSALKVPTLRNYIKSGTLPCFKVKGKILIRKSEFDAWLESYRVNRAKEINDIVDGIMSSLKSS